MQQTVCVGHDYDSLAPAWEPDLAAQGWRVMDEGDFDGFDGLFEPLLVRAGPAGSGGLEQGEALIRTGPRARNVTEGLHGGFLAAMAEKTLFLPLFVAGRVRRGGGAVTVDFSLQYLIGGDLVSPILAQVEMIRETGRLAFLRGMLVQNGEALVAYSATMRKLAVA